MAHDLALPPGVGVKTGLGLDDDELVALTLFDGRLSLVMQKSEARALGVKLCLAGIEGIAEFTPQQLARKG